MCTLCNTRIVILDGNYHLMYVFTNYKHFFHKGYKPQVFRILTGVVQSLVQQPTRKFIWGEVSFFEAWFKMMEHQTFDSNGQSWTYGNAMRHILKTKQFEFVGGGWVQHDEALVPIENMFDQMQGNNVLFIIFVKRVWNICNTRLVLNHAWHGKWMCLVCPL